MISRRPSSLSNWSVRIFIAVLFAGGSPLVGLILGLHFMSAPGYLSAINPPAIACAAVLALFNALALTRYELANTWSRKPAWRRRLVFIPVAMLVFVTAYLSVAVTLPMATALLTGHETEFRVVAGKQTFSARKVCRNPVNLTYPHFIYYTLCGVPTEVRQTINRGDLLTLEGHGNGFGLYYRRVSKSE